MEAATTNGQIKTNAKLGFDKNCKYGIFVRHRIKKIIPISSTEPIADKISLIYSSKPLFLNCPPRRHCYTPIIQEASSGRTHHRNLSQKYLAPHMSGINSNGIRVCRIICCHQSRKLWDLVSVSANPCTPAFPAPSPSEQVRSSTIFSILFSRSTHLSYIPSIQKSIAQL